MSADADARRIANGPSPSHLVHPLPGASRQPETPAAAPFDPLNLCVFATIALLGWLTGPVALIVFSAIGFVGYAKARRAGLTKSKCYLRDTRLVLGYLGILVLAGVCGTIALVARLTGS
jgi:hypothetical protein